MILQIQDPIMESVQEMKKTGNGINPNHVESVQDPIIGIIEAC